MPALGCSFFPSPNTCLGASSLISERGGGGAERGKREKREIPFRGMTYPGPTEVLAMLRSLQTQASSERIAAIGAALCCKLCGFTMPACALTTELTYRPYRPESNLLSLGLAVSRLC